MRTLCLKHNFCPKNRFWQNLPWIFDIYKIQPTLIRRNHVTLKRCILVVFHVKNPNFKLCQKNAHIEIWTHNFLPKNAHIKIWTHHFLPKNAHVVFSSESTFRTKNGLFKQCASIWLIGLSTKVKTCPLEWLSWGRSNFLSSESNYIFLL